MYKHKIIEARSSSIKLHELLRRREIARQLCNMPAVKASFPQLEAGSDNTNRRLLGAGCLTHQE